MAKPRKKRAQTFRSECRLILAILAGLTLFGTVFQAQHQQATGTRESVFTLSMPADLPSATAK